MLVASFNLICYSPEWLRRATKMLEQSFFAVFEIGVSQMLNQYPAALSQGSFLFVSSSARNIAAQVQI